MLLRVLLLLFFSGMGVISASAMPAKIYIIRHGEKPADGAHNLTCAGLNRALALPNALYNQMGEVASKIYVPRMNAKHGYTSHARMFETAIPYAVRYQVAINSQYDQDDYKDIVKSVKEQKGDVLMVWNHSNIPDLTKAFGVQHPPQWDDNNYSQIWIIDPETKTLTFSNENISPSNMCISTVMY